LTEPPPVQPRSTSLQPGSVATLQAADFSSTNNFSSVKNAKQKTQSLSAANFSTPPNQENLYSLAGQDATYGQHNKSGIPFTDYLAQSGIGQRKKPEGNSRRASVTSNGPPTPSGIPLDEALSMKGYGTLEQCTIGPAVPPRTPLNEALQIKKFNQMSVSEGDSAASTSSLVKEAEMDVFRMLRQQSFNEVQVKPGTPLNEALAQKGIVPRSSRNSTSSRSGSIPKEEPEDFYNVPRNNQPAFFPENDRSSNHYQSPRSAIAEEHYQSPRKLQDDPPDQLYNVPPPPRPAPIPRSQSSKKMRSKLLSQDSRDNDRGGGNVNGNPPPPVIDRSSKPRPPPINRGNKPGRYESSSQSDVPQMTKDSVHYVSLQKLREESKPVSCQPVPRPRTNVKKSDYSEVDLESTLAMGKKFMVSEKPQVPMRTRDSLLEVYSSDDDDDSTSSESSYTKMRVSYIKFYCKIGSHSCVNLFLIVID